MPEGPRGEKRAADVIRSAVHHADRDGCVSECQCRPRRVFARHSATLSAVQLPPCEPGKMTAAAMTHESAALKAAMEAVETAEAIAEKAKRRKTKARCVGIEALIFKVSGIVTVPGRKAQGISRREEVPRRARRTLVRVIRNCGYGLELWLWVT